MTEVSLDTVKTHESRQVAIRRQRARFTADPATPAADATRQTVDSTQSCSGASDFVGLALSGGGVRSAAMNLGLLQSLHKFGVLRFVDFLSTVSGGTYVGAAISHSVTKRRAYGREEFDFAITENGQPKRVRDLIANGNYLFRLHLLIHRYLVGFILNLLPSLFLLLSIGAFFAFLWRLLDYDFVRDLLAGLGFDSDIPPVVLPGAAIMVLWFICSVLSILLKSAPLKVACRPILICGAFAFLIGAAVYIGNNGANASHSEGGSVAGWLFGATALFTASAALGPMLNPYRLFQGVAPKKFTKSWIIYYVSIALVLGFPLLSVAYFAKENISEFGTLRGPRLDRGDIIDVALFSDWLLDPYRRKGSIQTSRESIRFNIRDRLLPVIPTGESDKAVEPRLITGDRSTSTTAEATDTHFLLERSAAQAFYATILLDIARQDLLGLSAWHAADPHHSSDLSPSPPQSPTTLPRRCAPCTYDALLRHADDELKVALSDAVYYEGRSLENCTLGEQLSLKEADLCEKSGARDNG